jgi:hypothetical protein
VWCVRSLLAFIRVLQRFDYLDSIPSTNSVNRHSHSHADTRSLTDWPCYTSTSTRLMVVMMFPLCIKSNAVLARRLHMKLAPFFLPHSSPPPPPLPLHVHRSVQQSNSYDCGVYVALFAQLISQWVNERHEDEKEDGLERWVKERATPSAVTALRQELKRVITNKAEQASRSRHGVR